MMKQSIRSRCPAVETLRGPLEGDVQEAAVSCWVLEEGLVHVSPRPSCDLDSMQHLHLTQNNASSAFMHGSKHK